MKAKFVKFKEYEKAVLVLFVGFKAIIFWLAPPGPWPGPPDKKL